MKYLSIYMKYFRVSATRKTVLAQESLTGPFQLVEVKVIYSIICLLRILCIPDSRYLAINMSCFCNWHVILWTYLSLNLNMDQLNGMWRWCRHTAAEIRKLFWSLDSEMYPRNGQFPLNTNDSMLPFTREHKLITEILKLKSVQTQATIEFYFQIKYCLNFIVCIWMNCT